MRKETSRAIVSLLSIVLTIIVADFFIGIVGRYSLKHLPDTDTEIARMKHSVELTKAECIIVGSSNASRDYNACILEDSLHVSVYNAGRDGREISYSLAVIKAILSRYTPKLIVLDLPYNESKEHQNRVNILKPFFKDYPQLLEVDVMVNGKIEYVKSFFNSYIFNSYFSDAIASYASPEVDRVKGFNPLLGNTMAIDAKPAIMENSSLTTTDIHKQCLIDICSICKEKGVNLIVVLSPEFVRYQEDSPLYSELDSLKIALYDYHNEDFYMNKPELFYDKWHLNEKGANIFSSRIATELKKELLRPNL